MESGYKGNYEGMIAELEDYKVRLERTISVNERSIRDMHQENRVMQEFIKWIDSVISKKK